LEYGHSFDKRNEIYMHHTRYNFNETQTKHKYESEFD